MTAERKPLVIAHRGASGDAPENTIAAFELALEQEADGIQLEVHLSKDNHPVVINDFTLERTTDGAGPVSQYTVRELKRLDAGGWRGARFRGQRLQTLQEVLERFRDRTRFWIELRGGSDVYDGIEERVVSTVEIYDVVERAVLQSVDHGALARVRALNREVRVALVVQDRLELPRVPWLHAVCPGAHLVGERVVAETREAGLDCYVWTVNEPPAMDRLIQWGVSGIITDRPAVLRARLGW